MIEGTVLFQWTEESMESAVTQLRGRGQNCMHQVNEYNKNDRGEHRHSTRESALRINVSLLKATHGDIDAAIHLA